MDLLKSFSGAGKEENKNPGENKTHLTTKHSTSELFGDAKTVAEAAKLAASGGTEKVDKAKTAGAASDLLEGAEDYGKLSEKGYGKYVDQAQGFLQKYEGTAKPSDLHDQDQQPHLDKYDGGAKPSDHQDENKSESGGGVGGYLKMAQGFMK